MDQARRLLREVVDQNENQARHPDRSPAADFESLLHLRPSSGTASPEPQRQASRVSSENWPAALDLVRQAAEVVRQSEHRVQEQDARIHELVQRVREELKAAQDRAQAAEARAQSSETRAESRIRAAEARAQVAEVRASESDARAKEADARANAAQEWLTQIHDTIVSQLSSFQLKPAKTKAA